MSEMDGEEQAGDGMATICIRLDEGNSSQQDLVSPNQLKGKRRNKLKMPLKKIPKRKRNSLTERINLCQDIGHFDFPDNLSALIVSSSVQGGIDIQASQSMPPLPLHPSLKKMASHNVAKANQGGLPSTNHSRQSESVDRHCKTMNPVPPLVSIARTPATKSSKNSNQSSAIENSLDRTGRHAMTTPGHSARNDLQTVAPSTSTLISTVQPDPIVKSSGFHQLFQGCCDHGIARTASSFIKQCPDSGPCHGNHGLFHVHPTTATPPETGGLFKYTKCRETSKPNPAMNRTEMTKYPQQPDTSKTQAPLNPSVKLYKQYLPDVRLPLVQVKPPLLTPISPERNSTSKTSFLTNKRSMPPSRTGSTRGRKPNDKKHQSKENIDVSEIKSPSFKKNQHKVPAQNQSVKPFLHGDVTDDDDVIITGVVNLSELQQREATDRKHLLAQGKKRNPKCVDVAKPHGCRSNFAEDRYNEDVYAPEINPPRSHPANNRKKQTCKRGGYTRKTAKSVVVSTVPSSKDSDTLELYENRFRYSQIKTDLVKSHSCVLTNNVFCKKQFKSECFEAFQFKETRSNPSVTTSVQEMDDQERDNHFSTIIDAIRKEDDLMKSLMNKKANEAKSAISDPDQVDWRSWLILSEKNNALIETGSGTDSGNEDDLILRDLSEFLLLSEDRRNYSKHSDEADSKFPYSRRMGFVEREFTFDESTINFDSIDSSINYINSIDADFTDFEARRSHEEDNGINYEENVYYSTWHSLFDHFPKYPLQVRSKNRSENYWRRFLNSEHNPTLGESDTYEYRQIVPDKERRLEESSTKAGLILRSESAERGIAPSYESKFYRKRIYRKKSKLLEVHDTTWLLTQ